MIAGPGPFSLGSDSHAVIDLFEEARAVELDERLARRERGVLAAPRLLDAATRDGHRALGWSDAGGLRVGARADLVAARPRVGAHRGGGATVENVVFAASAADVTDVVVDGRAVVTDRRHVAVPDAGRALAAAIAAVMGGPMSVLYDDIGELVTNDPAVGDGSPLGLADRCRDASSTTTESSGSARERGAPDADQRVDLRRRSVLPGLRRQPRPPGLRR